MPLPSLPDSSDMKKFLKPANFQLAWERLLRTNEPAYKWYWRGSASTASTIIETILKGLRDEVKQQAFNPNHTCIYSEPKASGLLRHRALLSVGDHIIYQAIVNVIADRAYPRIKQRFGVTVFGNLYNGPKEKFFLKDWKHSYRDFNDANGFVA